jgi:hypothetical protein
MIKKIWLVVLFQMICFAPVLPLQTGSIPEAVILAFRAGNAEELSKHFYNNIELILLENEDVYSKVQAEQILKKFFADHRPSAFNIIHEGGKETSRYAIGSLTTSSGNFRVSFLIKNQDGTLLIHQLRIEEENEDNL